jgi:multisubunit Na+/H+ antiporter MnhE subunit
MAWVLLAAGFFLFLTGILAKIYSLKTKRNVQPDERRAWRVVVRIALFVIGWWLMAVAVTQILHSHHPSHP